MKSFTKFLWLLSATPTLSLAQENSQNNLYEEIVVTSSRIEQPLRQVATAMSILTREELELKGYSTLADVLRTEASIGVSNNGGAGKDTALRIRGEESYRTLVMIDGVDMADPTGTQIGPQIQHLMNTQDIEQIEVLRGPQGFMYGADAGGVVNLITRSRSEGISGGLSLEGGAEDTKKFGGNIAGGNEFIDFSASISDYSTDGFNARTADEDLQDDDGADNTTLHLKGGWNISDNLRATIVYRDIDAKYQYDGCYLGSTTHDCVGNSDQQTGKLSLEYSEDSYSHSLSYANTDVERERFAESVLTGSSEGKTSELEYLGTYEISSAHNLVFGVDYEEDEITTIGSEIDRDQLGSFMEYQHNSNDNLFLTAGIRTDDNSDFGTHISYRFSAAYVQDFRGGDTLKYRATYGTGFRAPSLYEITYNSGEYGNGVELKEDSSKGFDVGIDYLINSGTLIQVTYFDQRIENEIFFDLDTFSGYLQESGEIGSKGIETSVEHPLTSTVSLSANYTYNDTDSSTDFTRSRRPEHLANLGLNFSALDDQLSVLANLRASHKAYNEIFGIGLVELDDYQVIDISAVYRVDESLEYFGRIQNLTDEDYEEVTGYNTQDRTFRAGVRFNF